MSKKSRRRNKALLAIAGLAGATALANRKPKQSDVSSDNLKRPELKQLKKIQLKKIQLLLLQKLFKTIKIKDLEIQKVLE